MNGAEQMESDGLEDRLRSMILASGSPNKDSQQFKPTVRLPPGAPQQAPYQPQGERSFQRYGANQAPQSQPSNYPRNPAIVQVNSQRGRPSGQGQFIPPHMRNGSQHQMHQQHQRGAPNFQQQHRPGFNNRPPSHGGLPPHQRGRFQQQVPLDPNAFGRGSLHAPNMRQNYGPPNLFNPNQARGPPMMPQPDQHFRQAQYLEELAASEIRNVDMSSEEHDEKDSFRMVLEQVCHDVCLADPNRLPKVSLETFGSFRSGFATAGSDMDLVIVVKGNSSTNTCFSLLEDDLPRVLEMRLLQLGYGARLLTRTRVPIIKVCEKPDICLLDKLREEREKWDVLPNEQKYPHLHPEREEVEGEAVEENLGEGRSKDAAVKGIRKKLRVAMEAENKKNSGVVKPSEEVIELNGDQTDADTPTLEETRKARSEDAANGMKSMQRQDMKPWTRERKAGPLDFPKDGIGIQSDINFFNPLGIHNTQMLRCYSLCDPRVRPIVLFVKAWAKRRKINSSYSGTLSSYGYVLMVLHYLINVAQPPVLPNLQQHAYASNSQTVDGWHVRFWRNEEHITAAAQQGQLTANREPFGSLLAGFFKYYASMGGGPTFRWVQEVLSLRSIGGLLTKDDKGWVKAVTEQNEGKKIQHRYLFCIEDPFELDHNVARTVTHNGIVAIRDEFRRVGRILQAVGNGLFQQDGELFAHLTEAEEAQKLAPTPNKPKASAPNGHTNGDAASQQASGPEVSPSKRNNQRAPATNHIANPNEGRGQIANKQLYDPGNLGKKWTNGAATPKSKRIDVDDNEAFPSLSGSKQSKTKVSPRDTLTEDYSEISGDKAKAYLEEVKRKKYEEQAEFTATGAAEAVLGDSD